jgi:hypothetical protein
MCDYSLVEAVGFMRTSSIANVGEAAIQAFAKRAGMVIVDWFYDAAVSGAERIEQRPGFMA